MTLAPNFGPSAVGGAAAHSRLGQPPVAAGVLAMCQANAGRRHADGYGAMVRRHCWAQGPWYCSEFAYSPSASDFWPCGSPTGPSAAPAPTIVRPEAIPIAFSATPNWLVCTVHFTPRSAPSTGPPATFDE